MPLPSSFELREGSLPITALTRIVIADEHEHDHQHDQTVNHLIGDVQRATGIHLARTATAAAGDIELRLDGDPGQLGPEGYALDIDEHGATVRAATPHGVWNGAHAGAVAPAHAPRHVAAVRAHPRSTALRVAGGDARCGTALLRCRPVAALHRADRSLQVEPSTSAPHRRPRVAHRHRRVASAHRGRRQHRRERQRRGLLHPRRLCGDRRPCRSSLHHGGSRARHARPHQRRARLDTGAEPRWHRTSRLHRQGRRLQLVAPGGTGDPPVHQRCDRAVGGRHTRPLPAHRRRRSACHRPCGVSPVGRTAAARGAAPPQADGRLGGDRQRRSRRRLDRAALAAARRGTPRLRTHDS